MKYLFRRRYLIEDGLGYVTIVLKNKKKYGNGASTKFQKSGKGKHLQTKVNEQVNASKGKSNTISKAKANVEGAVQPLRLFYAK